MKILSWQDLSDLLIGAEILGCGGGGTVERGQKLIDEVRSAGKKFTIVDPKEVPDEAFTFIISSVGGGVPEDVARRVEKLPRSPEKAEFVAARELAKYIGEEPYAYLASEIGAGNTIVPMYVAAMTGKYGVDADACGRAKPEVALSTTNVMGIPTTPLAVATPFGDIMILKKALDDQRAEDICRYMAVVSGGSCGVARCPAKGKVIKEAVVSNSVTKTISIGRAIREAQKEGRDPVDAFLKSSGGFKAFEGRVKTWDREKREAFMWGTIVLDGMGKYKNQTLKVWYKNEFLVSWKDGTPYIACPDSLCIIDAETGRGLSNWAEDLNEYVGKRVAVAGVEAAGVWKTKEGIKLFGPTHFGFDIQYKPVSTICGRPSS